MQIKTIVFAVAFALASTSSVAGEWLKNTDGKYAEYCVSSKSTVEVARLCFKATPAQIRRIHNVSGFQGYLAPDFTGFVVFGPAGGATLATDTHTLKVTLGGPDEGGSLNPGCSHVQVWTNKVPTTVVADANECYGDSYTLPDYF